jgi:alkylation response protein AidB-like acyl-CoA dehydrogenase
MDYALNEMQEMLQTSARDFLNAEYPEKLLRLMSKDDKGYTSEMWSKLIELGWTGLSIPEKYGGLGNFVDLIVILKEMGRVCFISPYFAAINLGAAAIIGAGNEAQKDKFLPDIASGQAIVTLALLEKSDRYSAEAIQMDACLDRDAYLLNGAKLFVPHAESADYIIMAARTQRAANPEYGITLFLLDRRTPGLGSRLLETIDGDKLSQVTCNNVRIPQENILGKPDQGWDVLKDVIAKAAIGRCAETVGACEKVLEMTLSYAKERMAFDHPIAFFQSVQHRCSDMLIDLESSRLITYKAAWLISEGLPALKETSIAKAWVNQAARRIVASAHQIHGAIGFTEDHILHLYTKRIRTNEFSFGDADEHFQKLADMLK